MGRRRRRGICSILLIALAVDGEPVFLTDPVEPWPQVLIVAARGVGGVRVEGLNPPAQMREMPFDERDKAPRRGGL
jgi:hypothetical protein